MDLSVATGGEKMASTCTTEVQEGDKELGHLRDTLEKARREEQAGRHRRAVMLAALCLLLLAAGSGLVLAILSFLRSDHDQSARLACRLVLAASAMSLIYIGFHLRGARSNRLRPPGAPHFFGEYTLAGALMVSRLAIGVWFAALVATAVTMASTPKRLTASPSIAFGISLPLLHLVVCLVAILSFCVIAAAIESRQAPFATAGLSPAGPPLRTYHCDEPADGIDEHISVSRRISMQRAAAAESTESLGKPPAGNTGRPRSRGLSGPVLRPLQLVTADTREDDDAKTELMANSPVKAAYRARPRRSLAVPPVSPLYSVPPVPPLPPLSKIRSLSQLKVQHHGSAPRDLTALP